MISRIAILWAGTLGCGLTQFFYKSGLHISVYYPNSGALSLLAMGVAADNNAKRCGITCLKPVFSPEGKATAASAGPISDNTGALNRINIR